MAREVRNTAASVLDRLRNAARETTSDFQALLSRYVLERLLYRLSASQHRDRFVLKGAMLFPLWLEDVLRPTRDLDLLGFGDPEPEALAAIFREIVGVPVPEDGVVFDADLVRAEAIREGADYGGVRVRAQARIGQARIPVQVDIGFGDAIVPAAAEADYPVLLDGPAPMLRVYPKETVVAEKFEAIVALGGDNSRMKDFYDLWALSERFAFEGEVLARALGATFQRRGTELPIEPPTGLGDAIAASEAKRIQWRAFTGRGRLAMEPGDLPAVVARLRRFLMPPSAAAARAESFNRRWTAGGPWREAQPE